MKMAYPIVLTPAGKGYVVYVPDLEINTEGDTIADAISMAADAISLTGITMQDMGMEIPRPAEKLPEVGPGELATFAVVDLDAYRRANDMRSVRKNVTIPSYLNELGERAGLSFSQVLQDGLRQRLGVK